MGSETGREGQKVRRQHSVAPFGDVVTGSGQGRTNLTLGAFRTYFEVSFLSRRDVSRVRFPCYVEERFRRFKMVRQHCRYLLSREQVSEDLETNWKRTFD
jgi:hypothetical protein